MLRRKAKPEGKASATSARRKGTRGKAANAKAARGRTAAKTPKRRSLLWRLLRWPVRLVLVAMLLVLAWVAAYAVIDPPGGLYMLSEHSRLGGIARDWRDMDEISPRLARSVMAAEDARFCDHSGFDFAAIREALERNAEGTRVYGASTLTQQVAKNVFLWHERSWIRKGLEAGFTGLIEIFWSKRRIMEVYLNTVEFDEGVFGAEAAAQHYFGRPALALTAGQAARLASILPAPKRRNAAAPSASMRRKARRVADGAATLARTGRDGCLFE